MLKSNMKSIQAIVYKMVHGNIPPKFNIMKPSEEEIKQIKKYFKAYPDKFQQLQDVLVFNRTVMNQKPFFSSRKTKSLPSLDTSDYSSSKNLDKSSDNPDYSSLVSLYSDKNTAEMKGSGLFSSITKSVGGIVKGAYDKKKDELKDKFVKLANLAKEVKK